MNRRPNKSVGPDSHGGQNAFALACVRAIGSASEGGRPWDSVRDWNRAVQILEIHGVLPILERAPEAPDDVRRIALEAKLRAATHQSNTLDALKDISRELQAAGIPYAVLKGTYLYELLYRELFPRAYGDIDLLVPAERIAEARSALNNAGYGGDPKQHSRASLPRWHFHETLTSRKPGGLPVELHRSLVDRANLYRLRPAELFGRLTTFPARSGSFTVLSDEDQLIYLCLHAAKHGVLNGVALRAGFPAEWYGSPESGNRLLWFLDLDLFLRKRQDRLDWPAVADRVQRWNVADDVRDGLRVLQQLQPESPAEGALQRLGDLSPKNGRPAVPRAGAFDRILRSGKGRALLERAMRAHPRYCFRPIRLLIVGRTLVPSPAQLLAYHGRKHRRWLPWLYLIHPFHLLRKLLTPD